MGRPASSHLIKPLLLVILGISVGTSTAQPPQLPPALFLDFEEGFGATALAGARHARGPRPPACPEFATDNQALDLPKAGSRLIVADPGDDSAFDFGANSDITLEAWVRPLAGGGEHQYIISKGRTKAGSSNQNYALRLSQGAPNFLFRSTEQTWHRWTGKEQLHPGIWNHIAVAYTFGQADSLEAWLNGKPIDGRWDMDGKTNRPPVQDNDDLWVGSAQGGAVNAFIGQLDNIAIHRRRLTAEELRKTIDIKPPPPYWPEAPLGPGAVLLEIAGPAPGDSQNALHRIPPQRSMLLPAMASSQIAPLYSSTGLRADWQGPLILTYYASVELPPGEHQILIRHRSSSRLRIDGKTLLTTPKMAKGSDKAELIKPKTLRPEMRRPQIGDIERHGIFQSTGAVHKVEYQLITGGTGKKRNTIGSSCAAISLHGTEPFMILGSSYPLNEAGWRRFIEDEDITLREANTSTRRKAAASEDPYWASRHQRAREFAQAARQESAEDGTASRIDQLTQPRVDGTNSVTTVYSEHILPILSEHCFRCHGDKEKGGLNLRDATKAQLGGDSGLPAIIPGDAEESQLIQSILANDAELRMPPKGDALAPELVQKLKTWISEGADRSLTGTSVRELPKLTDDYQFLRRLYLDTVGVPASEADIRDFVNDPHPDKRNQRIDKVLNDPRWADHWVSYWQDVLGENVRILKGELNNTGPFRYWIHDSLLDNKPLDRFVTELVMMQGGQRAGGPGAFALATQNDVPMAAKAHVIGSAFLGLELKCARCHDAPYHDYRQEDLFGMASMLLRKPITLPASSSVPSAFFKEKSRESLIKVTLVTGTKVQPAWHFSELTADRVPEGVLRDPEDTRERLAALITLPDNPRFAEVMANRVWKRFMGLGIVEPAHDWQDATPSHPELLSYLAQELQLSGYDTKHLARLILQSEAYQRLAIPPPPSQDASQRPQYAPQQRRMSAEQVVDSVHAVTGRSMETEELSFNLTGRQANELGTLGRPKRAWQFGSISTNRDRPSLALPKAQAVLDVLEAYGWRADRSEPRTERPNAVPDIRQAASLANSVLTTWVTRLNDDAALTDLAIDTSALRDLVDSTYLRILGRPPDEADWVAAELLLKPGFATRHIVAPKNPPPSSQRYTTWYNHLHPSATKEALQNQADAYAGPLPTRRLEPDWRERMEDLVWTLLNSPDFVYIP